MLFRCLVVETVFSHRAKEVVVEVESVEMLRKMRNFIHDEAAQMGGWQEDPTKESFGVLICNTAKPEDLDLDTITIDLSDSEVRSDGI